MTGLFFFVSVLFIRTLFFFSFEEEKMNKGLTEMLLYIPIRVPVLWCILHRSFFRGGWVAEYLQNSRML